MNKKSDKVGADEISQEKSLHEKGLLLQKWRRGIELSTLIRLLKSESTPKRLRGAYYLGELGVAVEDLTDAVTQLASDPMAACRRAFVAYMITSRFYDSSIANALAKCFQDLDLYVRVTAIKWAVSTSVDNFEDFTLVVKSGAGRVEPRFPNPLSNKFWTDASADRANRGLRIVARLRAGEKIAQFRKELCEEDSFIIDTILFEEGRDERYAAWKKSKSQH
ncbi:hypothetical protein RFM68_15330 [Mesorhizobium sp. MSK_1335]|uniref:HEAT repeat domain-containing protein n=1 Tax=Mesorhizobium montanum TaxID=3072323 RepID=A0ABU4ZKH8_9HYPH|nr:hypothetical protein [Mesorhizobium sp. MSK_1335]MDX8525884.1 hypothetical protein [Mesorhizobium sp. MSK_1335]